MITNTEIKKRLSSLPMIPDEIATLKKSLSLNEMDDMTKEVAFERISKLEKERTFLTKAVFSIQNPLHSQILRMRYIDGKCWESIAQATNYSWGGVHYQHNKALEEIDSFLDQHFIN